MHNSLILSIIVPVYNVEAYLEKCLVSLVTQDISDSEYEILCINDGSRDKSSEILDKYSSMYNNLNVIHKDNGGVSSARNCGIDQAKGKYIWFIDSDDFIKENSLSKIVSVLRKSDYDRIQIYPYAFNDKDDNFDPNEIELSMTQSQYKNFLWTQILKREIIVDNKVCFDTEISYAEDAIFMIQIAHVLKKSTRLDELIYFYRLRENSLMSQKKICKIESRIKGLIVCDEICKGKQFGDKISAIYFKYQSASIVMTNIANLPKNERKKYVKKLKSLKLFPLKYNAKFTSEINYKNKSVIKKLKLFLSNRAYTRLGYRLLLVYLFILKCYDRIENIILSKE